MSIGRPLSYLIAVGAVVIATLARVALAPLVGTSIPFLTYFLAALWLAWSHGFWPAAFAIALSIVSGGHFILGAGSATFLRTANSDRAAMMAFGIAGLAVAFLIDLQH